MAEKIIFELKRSKNQKLVKSKIDFIISEVVKILEKERIKQSEVIFSQMNKKAIICLAISSSKEHFKIPIKTEIYPDWSKYLKNIFEEYSSTSMDSDLERDIARIIDNKSSVLWWARNMARGRDWYFIRGWQKNKIYPDFIVAQKTEEEKLKLVYVFEAKGEHLLGNENSIYKKAVFEKINFIGKEQFDVIKFKVNKEFKFEFLEQGSEELEINKFLK